MGRDRIATDRLLADLRLVADDLGHVPSTYEYNEHGRFAAPTFYRRFGSWEEALDEADIPAPVTRTKHGLEALDPEDLGLSPIGERPGQPT